MESKEALDYMFGVAICGSGLGETADKVRECYNKIVDNLERLEKQDKILERLKRPMFYSERKKLGEEYMKWARENNVLQNDLTSIITWCFCFKMKEWLEND